MTSDQRRSFERQWPDLEQALHRNLTRRGVPAADREDIVQDTALRLLRVWDKIDLSQPLLPLVYTIALNLVRDNARKQPRREVAFGELPERPASSDVEREGLGRLDLQRVAHAMKDLSRPHRLVLLQEVDDRPRELDRGPGATKMLRMRARRRLCTLLETASAMVGLAALKLRRGTNDISQSTMGALAAVAVMATLPGVASAPVPHRSQSTANHGYRHIGASENHSAQAAHTARPTKVAPPALVSAATTLATGAGETRERRPVTIPVGDGEVGAEGTIDVDDVHVEVSDRGGPIPVCVNGVPGVPGDVQCPE